MELRRREAKPLDTHEHQHGGDLVLAGKEFGAPHGGWLDLSTGINPYPYPDITFAESAVTRLPQRDAMDALLSAARAAYQIAAAADLAAGPGSQSILQLLPNLRAPCTVAVLGPTYDEHALTWGRQGHRVVEYSSIEAAAGADVVVVVNPNNPDGRIAGKTELIGTACELARKDGWLILDEAFADIAPEISLAPDLDLPNTIVVRSFGKFFGLPGLRLGFAAGAPRLIQALARQLGPWAVSGPAIEIGRRALNDRDWIEATRARLASARQELDAVLQATGMTVVGGTDLFRLVETLDAQQIYRRLGQLGIFVRRFDHHPDWLRLGLPGSGAALHRLATALQPAEAVSTR